MRECQRHEKNMVAFLSGELERREEERFISHIDRCPHCQKEFQDMKDIIEKASSLKEDIAEAMASVDWDTLPSQVTDAVFKEVPKPSRKGFLTGLFGTVFRPKLMPVYAGILLGILIGSFATLMIFRSPFIQGEKQEGFIVSEDFLEKMELEMARRETLDYLDMSQYLLLDFVQYSPDERVELGRNEFVLDRAKDLISKKKYINPQLEKIQMAKAKEICDQIEFLFYELTQMRDQLSREDLLRIQRMIEQSQLLLKIKLLKRELEESEV